MNYYKYKNNYEKYVGNDKKGDQKEVIKTIASPKLMSKLNPVANLSQAHNINVNPSSQKGLLKYALNKDTKEEVKIENGSDSNSDDEIDYNKFGSKKQAKLAKKVRDEELARIKA